MSTRPIIDTTNPINRESPLTRGLVAWWQVLPGLNRGSKLVDLMGRHHGTLTNMDPATDWVGSRERGQWGGVEFESAKSQKVQAPFVKTTSPPFTLAVAFSSYDHSSATNGFMASWGNSGNDTPILGFDLRGSQASAFVRDSANSGPKAFGSDSSVFDGKFHLAVIKSKTTTSHEFWIDGKLKASSTAAISGYLMDFTNFTIGGIDRTSFVLPWSGIVHSAMHFDAAVDPAALNEESRNYFPTMLRRRRSVAKYVFVGGGTTPSGSASVNAVASLSVSGQTTRTGEADPVGVAAISVSGTAPNGGTASVSAVASIAATGHHLATASCSIDAIASLTVEGEAIRNGAVSIDAIASLSPSGTAPVVGTASGAASVVAVAGLSVVGETETSGSVSVDAIAGISVSGTAPSVDEASGSVSVDAVASLSIAGQARRTGESDVVAIASLAASGTAPNSGSVTLSAVASVAVSGQSSSQSIVPFQWYALLLAT